MLISPSSISKVQRWHLRPYLAITASFTSRGIQYPLATCDPIPVHRHPALAVRVVAVLVAGNDDSSEGTELVDRHACSSCVFPLESLSGDVVVLVRVRDYGSLSFRRIIDIPRSQGSKKVITNPTNKPRLTRFSFHDSFIPRRADNRMSRVPECSCR